MTTSANDLGKPFSRSTTCDDCKNPTTLAQEEFNEDGKMATMLQLLISVTPSQKCGRQLGEPCTRQASRGPKIILTSVKIHLLRWKMNINLPIGGTRAYTSVPRRQPVCSPKANASAKIHVLRWKMNINLPFGGTRACTSVTRRQPVCCALAIMRCRKLVSGMIRSRVLDEADYPCLGHQLPCSAAPTAPLELPLAAAKGA